MLHSEAGAAARRGQVAFGIALLVALTLLAVLRSHVGTRLDSFTVDEPWHIVAGASYVRSGDYRLNPEHPPLAKLWVGGFMPKDFKLRPPTPLSEKVQERDLVEETMFYDNDPERAQRRARIGMWSLHALLLFALGLVLWRALGLAWAAGSLAVLAIEPTVAAHLPVVMTDLPLALTLLVAAAAAGLMMSTWRWRWVLLSGLALGLALGAKHSALAGVAGIAVVAVLSVLSRWRADGGRMAFARLGKLTLAGACALAVLWAQYGFQFHAGPDGSDHYNRPIEGKISELNLGHWRGGIALADRLQLLPRPYLWGLADTVRTGVEGRGISQHLVWGRLHDGRAPWFSWPAIVLSKMPLALLLLAALGMALLWKVKLPREGRWVLASVAGAAGLHLVALLGSDGIWGGVRHAMPLLVVLAVPAGAVVKLAWDRRSRAGMLAVAALFAAATVMTVREPRAWEYHNELVGGTSGAWRYFDNEGLDLGQRFGELRAFHDRAIKPGGQPMYTGYWMGEEQLRAAGMNYRRRVEGLDDNNVQGIYEGYFIYTRSDQRARPAWDWDPKVAFAGLEKVAQFGHVDVWRGRQVVPRTRAWSLSGKVNEYLYKDKGRDWALVARRLEEVVALYPQAIGDGIELGNAYLQLGDRAAARRAYLRPLTQKRMPIDARVRKQVEAQVLRLDAGTQLASMTPVRNPFLE